MLITISIASAFAVFVIKAQKEDQKQVSLSIEKASSLGDVTAELLWTFEGEDLGSIGFSFDDQDELVKYAYTIYVKHVPNINLDDMEADYSKITFDFSFNDSIMAEYIMFDVQYVETIQVGSQYVSEFNVTYDYKENKAPANFGEWEVLNAIYQNALDDESSLLNITVIFDKDIYGLED